MNKFLYADFNVISKFLVVVCEFVKYYVRFNGVNFRPIYLNQLLFIIN